MLCAITIILALQATNSDLAAQALAHAEAKEFSQAVSALQQMAEPDAQATVDVVNAIYNHCWSNFDAEFNRKCWLDFFNAFPDSPYASVAASRLLMAGLKDNAADEIKRFEEYFSGLEPTADSKTRYVNAYLNANQSNARVLELAIEAWGLASEAATAEHGDNVLECQLDTDHTYNSLAKATLYSPGGLNSDNPLFAMEVEPSVTFTEVTSELGLSGIKETRIAAGDFDNDGDADLSFCGRLFLNDKGTFVEVTKERGITNKGVASAFADYDGDGYLDLLVAAKPKSFLYRNLGKKGDYAFEDVSESSKVNAATLGAQPEGITFSDVDNDGDLDIYLALYENADSGTNDILLLNDGKGKFTSVTLPETYCGRGINSADIDGDGDQELFISNYRLNPNQLLSFNGKDFDDTAKTLNIKGKRKPEDGEYFGHTIGSCWGDVNNDGRLDLFSANLAHPRFIRQGFSNLSFLGIQNVDGTFDNTFADSGIRFQETHSDPALIDIDNDGDLDLSITCVYEGVPSALYLNDGSGKFSPITFRSGAAVFHGWGQSWLDINGDGFLDVIYASSSGARAFINSGNDNHYLRIKLSAKGDNTSAFGALVSVTEKDSETPRTYMRQQFNMRGTSSQDEAIVHFGLGDYSGRLLVEITWPDTGKTQKKRPKADQVYVIKR